MDSTPERPVWTTSSLDRTAWADSAVFGKPHATYYEHETGVNQVKAGTTSAIAANIESGDFDLDQQRGLGGDGEFMLKVRRIIPDFLQQTGTAIVTLNLRDFPNQSSSGSSLGPFDVTTSTTKVDTRARGRAASLKISNSAQGAHWKLGTFKLDIQPDGRR